MSATTPDVPLHPHTDRWVFRSSGESGRVSRAERRGVYGDDEARRACADASEKPDLPWHRTTSSSRILTLRRCRVKAFLSLGEFAHDATAGIFNDYVALQVWAGAPELSKQLLFGDELACLSTWPKGGWIRWGWPCLRGLVLVGHLLSSALRSRSATRELALQGLVSNPLSETSTPSRKLL